MQAATPADPDLHSEWLGRTEKCGDLVTAAPIAALSATLDRDEPEPLAGSDVPLLWHWLFFTPVTPQSELGLDGHALRGGFLPPVALPRRMWAGGRLEFFQPLRIGDEIVRDSRIREIRSTKGRSGLLVFVGIRHEIANALGVAISEEQDIVYRDPPREATAGRPAPAPTDESFRREIAPDPVLLFRYSALTFNGHRIHYDRTYATQTEGYPGLVVQGPLIATLLIDLLRREAPYARVRRFAFKAVRPTFDLHSFTICGRPGMGRHVDLWARDHEGALAMEASAELA